MKMFWQFIVSVVTNFVFLVSGSILALYYVFVAPYLPSSIIKTVLDVSLPLLCFFIACYMAWRKQQIIIRELQKTLEEKDNKKPLYNLEIVEDLDSIKSRIAEVDDNIKSARISKNNAPTPHPYLGRLGLGEPTASAWQEYIDELVAYKSFLQTLINGEEYRIINFTLKNAGYGDTNVNIELRFNGFTQEVDFYDDKVEYEEPSKPSSSLAAVMPLSSIGVANKLGNRREVQTDKPDRVVIEVDRIRHDDTVWLHYNPVFIKKTDGEQKIEYSIKSDRLTDTEVGAISL